MHTQKLRTISKEVQPLSSSFATSCTNHRFLFYFTQIYIVGFTTLSISLMIFGLLLSRWIVRTYIAPEHIKPTDDAK